VGPARWNPSKKTTKVDLVDPFTGSTRSTFVVFLAGKHLAAPTQSIFVTWRDGFPKPSRQVSKIDITPFNGETFLELGGFFHHLWFCYDITSFVVNTVRVACRLSSVCNCLNALTM